MKKDTNFVVFKVTKETSEELIKKLLEICIRNLEVGLEWDERQRILTFKDFSKFSEVNGQMIKHIASLNKWIDISKVMCEIRSYKLNEVINSLK